MPVRWSGVLRTPSARRAGLLLGVLVAGLVSLLLYASRCPEPAAVLGSGLMVFGATALVGGGLGFLFGVPRTVSSGTAAAGDDGAGSAGITTYYQPNTNLELVSDWLTKLLIGAGLTQLPSLAAAFRRLTSTLAPALGGRPDSAAFAGALVAGSFVFGFLCGWLATRLYLAPALRGADRQVLDYLQLANRAEAGGDHASARELRTRAAEAVGQVQAAAEQYEALRAVAAGGKRPTAELEALVSGIRSLAALLNPADVDIRRLWESETEGQRVVALALMQGRPQLLNLDFVVEAIESPRSGFELEQALVVADAGVHELDAQGRSRLQEAVRSQLAPGGRITAGGNRDRLARRILEA
ncbi:hypothetical protein ACFVGY_11735 [Streptomyces sp. NPDC127106]|uniref:hypothetical protein n=1 Tax=Streptomyces sp. NPDC127106 TaxID=3345360 RepID=UPI00363AF986